MNLRRIINTTALVFVSFFGVFFVSTQSVSAASCQIEKAYFLTIPAWYNYLPGDDSSGECEPTLGGGAEEEKVNTSLAIGVAILEGVLKASTFVAVGMVFWGSFKFITTQGNPDSATKARQTVINAAIGFAIVLIASQVVAYVGRTLVS